MDYAFRKSTQSRSLRVAKIFIASLRRTAHLLDMYKEMHTSLLGFCSFSFSAILNVGTL